MTEKYGEYEQANGAVANRLRKENSQMREALIEIASGVVPRHVGSPADGGEPPRYGWAVNLARETLAKIATDLSPNDQVQP